MLDLFMKSDEQSAINWQRFTGVLVAMSKLVPYGTFETSLEGID